MFSMKFVFDKKEGGIFFNKPSENWQIVNVDCKVFQNFYVKHHKHFLGLLLEIHFSV